MCISGIPDYLDMLDEALDAQDCDEEIEIKDNP